LGYLDTVEQGLNSSFTSSITKWCERKRRLPSERRNYGFCRRAMDDRIRPATEDVYRPGRRSGRRGRRARIRLRRKLGRKRPAWRISSVRDALGRVPLNCRLDVARKVCQTVHEGIPRKVHTMGSAETDAKLDKLIDALLTSASVAGGSRRRDRVAALAAQSWRARCRGKEPGAKYLDSRCFNSSRCATPGGKLGTRTQ